MANISETELQRRLRSLERTSGSSTEHNYVSNGDPEAGSYTEGDTHYNASTNNLWLFSNGAWALDASILHVRYADDVTTQPPVAQSDVVGFSSDPLSPEGSIKSWRGLWWGNITASTNPLAYEWIDSSTAPPELERYRTTKHGLRSDIGTPDAPGSGVTWVLGGPLTDTMWLADRFTIDGQKGPWEVYPVQAAQNGFPFIRYEKTGFNQPTLGDTVWIQDVIIAAIAFTGRPFTNQKELGYGSVVVIAYDDGTLVGKYIRSAGIDSWVTIDNLIEGDLVVDGTIVGDKIQANTIDATKIVLSGVGAIGAATVSADPVGSAADAEAAAALYADGLRSALISNEIAGVQAIADGKIESFFQAAEPITGISEGDLWFDTDDGNKPYRWSGSLWIIAQDDGLKVLADDAQATADGKITTYFQTAEPTTDLSVGDLWFDTDDGNKPYRYSGTSWVDAQDNGLFTIASNAQSTADGKIESFFQTTEPTTGISVGDLWFDTDDGNKPYRYSGTSWVLAQDDGLKVLADDAQATADGKITTYFQIAEPTTDISVGDLWFDTDDGNRPYRHNGTSWVDAQDSGIAALANDAQATADGKIDSFFQDAEPTTGMSVGDLWFDTDDGNKPYRYSGTLWVLAQDDGLKVLADDAQATADGKITTYFQIAAPTTDLSVGDLWFDTDDGNRSYRYNGTSWVDAQDSGLATLANDAQATADGKIDSFFQDAEPTTGMSVGDLWFDTDDGNKPYRHNGTSWVLAQDDGLKALADDAQATADGKVTTYFQTAAPTTDLSVGDLWFDLDDNNKPYRYSGSTWVDTQDLGLKLLATTAQSTADGKIESFFQTTAPTTGMSFGDLWFDTNDGNKPYRWSGSAWVDNQDAGLKILAEDAQATADGKITTYYVATEPTTSLSVGDLWVDTDDANRMYRYNGSAWVDIQDLTVSNNIYTLNTTTIEGGNITTGTVESDKISMNGPIEFNATASGLHWNKSAYGDGLAGGFIGRHVTSGGVDAIGLDFTSSQSSIRMSSGGRLITQGILLETGVPGTSTEYDTVGTHTFTITSGVGSLISVVITGGGGGGANNWTDSFHPGNPGGSPGVATTAAFLNSSGAVIGSVITASGGTGAGDSVWYNNINMAGVNGGDSLHAQGGAGGAAGNNGGSAGSKGSGGGGAGGSSGSRDTAPSTSPSGAGSSVADVLTVPSGAVSIRVIIGSGGAGGPNYVSGYPGETPPAPGGTGGAGFASVTPPSSGSQLFDFDDLANNSVPWPTLGAMTTTSLGSLTSLGSGGAGWYYVAVINGNNGNGSAANFVGMPHYFSGTPTAGGTSAIWYKMK